MPRLVLKMIGNTSSELHTAAAGVECGSMCYVVAQNPFNFPMSLQMRCIMAGVTWYAYEKMLQTKV